MAGMKNCFLFRRHGSFLTLRHISATDNIDKRSRTHDQMVQAAVGQAEYFGDQPGKRDFEGECISLKSFCRPEAGRGPRLNLASFATNFAPFAVEDLTAKDAKVNAKDAEAHRALHS